MNQRQILVVEDDASCAQILCAMASLNGWYPTAVSTMTEAMERLLEQGFEMTLLDLSLPDSPMIKTLDAIPDLRQRGAGSVVVVTAADATPELERRAVDSGAKALLSKSQLQFRDALLALMN